MGKSGYRHVWYIPVLLVLVAACHDAPRKNPFDPELTPAVEIVSAAVDTTTGSVVLEFTGYEGGQPFAGYRVLRKVQGLEDVDTVAVIADRAQTTLRDMTIQPDLDYLYWVEVVNQGGFAVPSAQELVRSFSVPGVSLFDPQPDKLQGTISLRWERYIGPDFERYEVWRRISGQVGEVLEIIEEVADTVWVDHTPLPRTEYFYWVRLVAANQQLESQQRSISYNLPGVELQQAAFSSETAAAELAWTAYQGPRFAAYEVHRQSGDRTEHTVAELEDVTATTFIDTLLDGNTEYFYRIGVRTTWEGVEVESNTLSGEFYGLEGIEFLPPVANNQAQAVGLALDEEDQLYIATTLISTTTAGVMNDGVRIKFPDKGTYRTFFREAKPHRLSPLYVAARKGRVYVAIWTEKDTTREDGSEEILNRILVGGVDEGQSAAWFRQVDAEGAVPAGLYVEEDGQVLMVDTEGIIYRFSSADGEPEEPSDKLRVTLETNRALPLQHMVVGPGVGVAGNDQFFLLTPQRDEHHIVGSTRVGVDLFGGRTLFFDDGVGPGNGQTLNPLVLAFDPSRTRLMVLEWQGRLQVLNATSGEVPRRYITRLGRFGSGEGEFQVSPPTAVSMVVDSQGKIYVADGEERIQIFVP